MFLVAMASVVLSMGVADLPSWTFDTDAQGWSANQFLKNVSVQNGMLCADASGSDPFFTMTGLNIEAKPWQYVVISIKASAGGRGELFWSGETTGQYGGLSQEKTTSFTVAGGGAVEDVVLFPFWQKEGAIRQLRLDLYDGAHFEIDAIRVMSWGGEAAPVAETYTWNFGGDVTPWRVHPASNELFAPPLKLDIANKGWVAVTIKSDIEAPASILWSTGGAYGLHAQDFVIEARPEAHTYLVEMEGVADWRNPLDAFGIRLPKEQVRIESIAISDKPLGAPDLVVTYLGSMDALNRTGMPSRVLAVIKNQGGTPSEACTARMALSPDLRFSGGCNAEQQLPPIAHGEKRELVWTVMTQVANTHKLFLKVGNAKMAEGSMLVTKSLLLSKADYVPQPVPVRTSVEVLAYYFPGWNSDAKWDCIRSTAPNRRPALGYYDESNPECVDWQIKWAVENGISCFLVDWYWCAGSQSLCHWFDAYRKARYRDMLKVSIMWANHNAPNTHSVEDWRNVTRHWIDNYFNLPAYYKLKDKPAVFIWAPSNIRRDLNGSAAVKQCFDESQAMAKEAGYQGITFVAVNGDYSPDGVKTLLEEGYTGITNYHEWGEDAARAQALKRMAYSNVVKGAPDAWAKKNAAAGALTYYPLVDTGWDSRPWHGNSAFVIDGRTPQLFESLLEKAKTFAVDNSKNTIILGPVNEWGEGSYIEPCVEYGFDMLDVIRTVFGTGNAKRWPVNTGPRDVGRGLYDYPPPPRVNAWTFDNEPSGWKSLMGIGEFKCASGFLQFRTTSNDPAIVTEACGVRASEFSKALVTMQIVGNLPEGSHGQIFWSTDNKAASEDTSAGFALILDGQPHEYVLDLGANPQWHGRIASLRLDPCNVQDVQVIIDAVRLVP